MLDRLTRMDKSLYLLSNSCSPNTLRTKLGMTTMDTAMGIPIRREPANIKLVVCPIISRRRPAAMPKPER